MKIELQLLCDPNGYDYNEEIQKRFYEGKNPMEDYLAEYAKHGILPRMDDSIHFKDSDGYGDEYLVVLPLEFYKDLIMIFVRPI